ncbi:MAG: DUF362 domain-containing protein [Candidatus Omnitrophica bacterium]|nr:DUF362 domain-containing protein [Candidatus Omnitrophota bacterium]MDD5574002.1 DUF362 domain-containing protein [Candidatus Omnitrophota bacterium]
MIQARVSFARCPHYLTQQVEEAVRRCVGLLGGPEAFVRRGQKVLIKPNVLTDASPEEGIDTHPEVVRAAIRLVKPLASVVYCGDSPSVWGEKKDIDRVYEVSGIGKVCREEGVELVAFTKPKMRGGYPLTEWLDKVDKLVNVPKFKTHGYTMLTAGVKNLFGLVVGMNKMKIHRDRPHPEDLSRALVDIYEARKPDLTVLDGIVAMEGDGPGSSGRLRLMELIAAATDAMALDMVMAVVMGLEPYEIPTNKEGMRRGFFEGGLKTVELLGEDIRFFVARDFALPKTSYLSRMPRWALNIVTALLTMKPFVRQDHCRACGLCRASCPAGACQMSGGTMVIDDQKCILCLCCQEICPHQAIGVRKNFLLRLMSGK